MSELYQQQAQWHPTSEDERKSVRQQLERVLASPLFRNSKRYPALLRFVVEQSLDGNEDQLKERLLGIHVFHRQPDYDTNQDTIVRLTAAEVRKRIAQYYQQPEHKGELRIHLNSGSYVPHFTPVEELAPVSQRADYLPTPENGPAIVLDPPASPAKPNRRALVLGGGSDRGCDHCLASLPSRDQLTTLRPGGNLAAHPQGSRPCPFCSSGPVAKQSHGAIRARGSNDLARSPATGPDRGLWG